MAEPAPIRLLLVDDEMLFRDALTRLLQGEPGFMVVGAASDANEAYQLAERLSPDIVLLDLRMPRVDGIETMRRLRMAHPGLAILVLTSFESDSYIHDALQAGANGYLLKDSSPQALSASIRSICAGTRTVSGAVWERVLRLIPSVGQETKSAYDGLTTREVQIVRLLATGLANKQIAYQLKVSEKTIRNHISNIYEKLQITDRAQAVLYAARKGLVQV